MFLRGVLLSSLLLACAPSHAAPVDRVRALLYRADGEALVARLHPDAARENADAAARFARQAGERVAGDPLLRPGGRALERAAENLRSAAREREDASVRDAAIEVAVRVRELDALLPAPPIARSW